MALKKLVSDLTQGLGAYPNHNTPSDSGGFNYGQSTSIFDSQLFNQRSIPYFQPLSRQENPTPLLPQILPGVNEEPNESTIFITDSPDGFIRGGETNAIKRAATDKIRIERFFVSGEGISFINNQKALQKSNPIIQEGGGDLSNSFEDIISETLGYSFTENNTNRVFNENNLIKQISEGGYTGNYYNRAGNNPEIQSQEQNKYEAIHRRGRKFDSNVMGSFNNHSGLEAGNRLISLGKKLSVGIPSSFNIDSNRSIMEANNNFDIGGLVDNFNQIKNSFNDFLSNPLESLSQPGPFSNNPNVGFAPGENIIYQFKGGPGSTYGVGDTILYRYQRTGGSFDHEGRPLTFKSYYDLQFQTTNQPVTDNSFNTLLTNTLNENLFGGNNIVGAGGLLFDNDFNFNPLDEITGNLADQIFGEDTVNFVTDLFDGNGVGDPLPGLDESVPRGSYELGGFNTLEGISDGFINVHNDISGFPINGFIRHDYKSPANPDGLGFAMDYKPDDVVKKLELKNDPVLTTIKVGKVVDPTNYLAVYQGFYQPSPSQISKEGRARLEEDSEGNITSEYLTSGGVGGTSGSHYYSQILAKKVVGSTRNYTYESRIGSGRPGIHFEGKDKTNKYSLTTNKNQRIDKINALDIHTKTDNSYTSEYYRDLIRFQFEAIDTRDPDTKNVMVFRALLDSYADSYTGEWNNFKYNGRAEKFYTYAGFDRKVSFGFKIAAQSRFEMKPLYRKLNYLATTLAPDLDEGGGGMMRASYIKVTIGSLLNRVPGFLTSMNIKWQKDYPWEIAIANPEIDNLTDTDMQALPHVLDVDCQFVPIHDFVPRKSVDSTPFFGKTNGDSGTARDFYDKGAETFSTVKSRVEQTGNSNGE